MKHRAIVIELGVNGLGVVRSLAREGVPVTGVYTEPGPGVYSRHCTALPFPPISENPDEFKAMLLDLCRSEAAPPVLFPTSDEAVQFISDNRDELAEYALFPAPPRPLIDGIISKTGTFGLAAVNGIPIPATFTFGSLEDIDAIAEKARFPVIFKPDDTFSVHLPRKEKNLTFSCAKEMTAFFREYPSYAANTGVLQEIVWGGDGYIYICAGYFDGKGDPLALYTGRKIRQHLPDYGVTCYGESLHVPELSETTSRFMKSLGYHGLAAVEYTRERATGDFYFLEINARSYYHNSLFLSCGVNLPYVAYLDLTGSLPPSAPPVQKAGVRWIDFGRDVGSFWRKYRKKEIGLCEWLASVFKARSFGVFDSRDLKPFLYGCGRLLRVAVMKCRFGRGK